MKNKKTIIITAAAINKSEKQDRLCHRTSTERKR